MLARPESRAFSRTWVPSACGRFRYVLGRRFVERQDRPLRLCVWMNPSTADDKEDDASIRVGMGYAWRWGDGGILVVNVLDLILTDSTKLPSHEEATGPEHDRYVRDALLGVHGAVQKEVLCGWGDAAAGAAAERMLFEIRHAGLVPAALALTKSGNPAHPLRKSKDLVSRPIEELLREREAAR